MVIYDETKQILYIPSDGDKIFYENYEEKIREAYQSGYTAGFEQGVADAEEECNPDYSKKYLTFEILSSGTINWRLNRNTNSAASKTIFYSLNGGEWTELTSTYEGDSFSVSSGDIVMFKGENETYSYNDWANIQSLFYGSTAVFNIYGNIMSLIYGDDFLGKYTITDVWNFYGMFGRTNVVDASNLVLPATACTNYSYANMFSNCTSLVYAPSLPATTLARGCYSGMFGECTSLISAPDLAAPVLPQNSYEYMFYNCTGLNRIKCLATDISAGDSCFAWLSGVAQSGTFIKAAGMNDWPAGANGIPEGWTVIDAE